ncbi:SPOR domain-containing protein [Thalassomonas actiniarum]|uniref:SPOR domain-containing protein n=1 Tax=Thalassomonas actiniarum TaxID=485447 RepID=A0AAE9YV10_9GAMM|nr:SPOR domain-containing protein [Thalassomonas actiniarum]WDE00864.1 SPOR domain-containing protein [Thalassomonas actiniarum]
MSTPFQNRLVGTVIVAAAIVIFLPDWLDGEKKTYQADFEAIPEAPAFKAEQEVKRFPREKLKKPAQAPLSDEAALDDVTDDNQQAGQTTAPGSDDIKVAALAKDENFTEAGSTAPESTKTVKVKEQESKPPAKAKVDVAWVIQLGSFRHKKNVDELLSKLKKNGYTAFTKPIKTQKGTLTKVFIGPELHKTSLEKKLPELKRLTKVQGKLARFYPTKQ